jgi:ATP-dependent Clp protease ATP-binding subunit ClpA
VQKFVLQLEAQLADRGVTFELSDEAVKWLAEKGYDSRMGARPLGRVIQENIKQPLADEVLFGKLKKGGTVKVSVETKEDGTTGLNLEAIEDAPVMPKPEPVPKASRPRRKPKPAAGNDGPPDPDQPGGSRRGGLVPKVPLKTL